MAVSPGVTYVASYVAPQGRYAADYGALSPAKPRVKRALTATRGVFTYGGGVPNESYRDTNYYVDVVFRPASATTPTPAPSPIEPTACTEPTWTSANVFGTWATNGYKVNNNIWNTAEAGPQTIYACAWNNWYVVSDQPGTGTDDGVKTYPDTQKHVSIPVGRMTSIPATFDVTTPNGGGTVPAKGKQWNAAFDLWLDDWATEVMVWTNWTMNWQYWYGVHRGEQVTIDGVAYHAYTNGSALWFIRDNVTNKGSVDLASILKWSVNKGWLKPTAVLQEIEYGFEVAHTGEPTRFSLNDYTLKTP